MASFEQVIQSGEQVTFEYKFRPSERFEPRELGLILRVFYAGTHVGSPFILLRSIVRDTYSATTRDVTPRAGLGS